ncbi:MAG: RNA polymerase sigma factor [Planctomycetota bacterium]|jgi:RNA polymerase sigma-70 factor (ECF subfamily)
MPDAPTITEAARDERGDSSDDPTRRLVEAARRGDRAALGALHDEYAPMVHAILLVRVGAQDAEDQTQEVFLMALRKLPTLRDPNAFGPWLAAIARRSASRLHRRRRRRGPEEHLPPDVPAAANPDADAARREAGRVLDAIRRLPEAYHETLLLRLVAGWSGPMIAERTGLSDGSVRVNLHRGIKLLRAELGEP